LRIDLVLLIVRAITGITMVYYGWPKLRDPKKTPRTSLALVLLATGPGAFRPGLSVLASHLLC
jgi:hypothetical protein